MTSQFPQTLPAADHPPVAMRVHELKTDCSVYEAAIAGNKPYEIRKNDRGFAVGETLWLRETQSTGVEMRAGAPLAFTGRECRRKVTHVLHGAEYGVVDGFAILAVTIPVTNHCVEEHW